MDKIMDFINSKEGDITVSVLWILLGAADIALGVSNLKDLLKK